MIEFILYVLLYLCCLLVVHFCFVHWRTCLMIVSRLVVAFILWAVFYIAMEMEKNNMWATFWKAYESNKHRFEL